MQSNFQNCWHLVWYDNYALKFVMGEALWCIGFENELLFM